MMKVLSCRSLQSNIWKSCSLLSRACPFTNVKMDRNQLSGVDGGISLPRGELYSR